MKEFYNKHSIKIITGTLAVVLIVMYIWLTIFTKNAHLTDPVFTRDVVEKIEIKNFIGRIELTTSENDGFKLEFTNKKPEDPAGYYPLFKMGTDTIATVDGRFAPNLSCDLEIDADSQLQSGSIKETEAKSYNIDTYPILKITAKHDVILDVRRSNIFGFAGNIEAAKFIDVKCSHFTIGKIADAAEFDLRADSTIIADDISGDLELKSQGENTLILQNISGNTTVEADGTTRLYAAEISGNFVSTTTGNNRISVDKILGNVTEN